MSEDYDPIRDRLDEKLYKEELEPIRMKFIEYLVDNKIDPVNMIITRPVVEDVIKLMGVDYRDWKNFTMTDEDYTKIGMEDMVGGTFTISNGGVYGSLMGTPIINPPQSAILGMHGIFKRPVAIGNEVKIRPMMYIALTYDHRIIDGKDAVTFLKDIKNAAVSVDQVADHVVRYRLESGPRVVVLADGHPLNIVENAGSPEPVLLHFALLGLTLEWVATSERMSPGEILVPNNIEQRTAELALQALRVSHG